MVKSKGLAIWQSEVLGNPRVQALFDLFASEIFSDIRIRMNADGLDIRAMDSSHIILIFSRISADGKQQPDVTWFSFTTEEFKNNRGKAKKTRKTQVTAIKICTSAKDYFFCWELVNGDSFRVKLATSSEFIPDDSISQLKAIYTEKSKSSKPGHLPDTNIIEDLDLGIINKIHGTFSEISDVMLMRCINQQLVCLVESDRNEITCDARLKIKTNKGEAEVIVGISWFKHVVKYFLATDEHMWFYMPTHTPVIMEDEQGITSFLLAPRVQEEEIEEEDDENS